MLPPITKAGIYRLVCSANYESWCFARLGDLDFELSRDVLDNDSITVPKGRYAVLVGSNFNVNGSAVDAPLLLRTSTNDAVISGSGSVIQLWVAR